MTFDSPFLDPEKRASAISDNGVPSYVIDFGTRIREKGNWSNGWAVTWTDYFRWAIYGTAIQVGPEFYFMPTTAEFAPGFKTFAEMREIVGKMESAALERERVAWEAKNRE